MNPYKVNRDDQSGEDNKPYFLVHGCGYEAYWLDSYADCAVELANHAHAASAAKWRAIAGELSSVLKSMPYAAPESISRDYELVLAKYAELASEAS